MILMVFLGFYTYAWFSDSKSSGPSTITLGKVQMKIDGEANDSSVAYEIPFSSTTGLLPHDPFFATDVTVDKTADSVNCFLRIYIMFSTEETAVQNYATIFNGAIDDFFTNYSTTYYKFVKSGNYYYLTDAVGIPLALGDENIPTGVVALDCESDYLRLPSDMEQNEDYAQYAKDIVLNITFQVVQSEWIEVEPLTVTNLDLFMDGVFL